MSNLSLFPKVEKNPEELKRVSVDKNFHEQGYSIHHDHVPKGAEDEDLPTERKISGKFSGIQKIKKARDNNLSKKEESAFLFNLF